MIGRRALICGALGGAVPLGACDAGSTRTLRYRLTLRALLDGEMREGSAIHEVRWRPNLSPGNVHGGVFRMRFWAEAPVMDCGAACLVFGLLSPPGWASYGHHFNMFTVFAPLRTLLSSEQLQNEGRDAVPTAEAVARVRGEHALPREYWPALVRFRDIDDRTTAESVEPDNFPSVFGRGARFDGAFMEIVTAQPTQNIERVLPWLREIAPRSGQTLTGGYMGPAISSQLDRENFQMRDVSA